MLSRAERTFTWIVLLVVSLIILYPLATLLSAALEPLSQGAIGISFAHAFSWQSFSYAWTVGNFRSYLWNTVVVTLRWWRSRRSSRCWLPTASRF